MDTSINNGDLAHEKEITLSDLVLDIWRSRVFIIIFVTTTVILGFLTIIILYPRYFDTICIVSLNFPGIEKKEYPDTSPFRKDDIIAPNILSQAFDATELAGNNKVNLKDMVAIQAIIPPEIRDKSLEKKAEDYGFIFSPNQFRIVFRTNDQKQISNQDKEKILTEVVEAYRRQVFGRYYLDKMNILKIPDCAEENMNLYDLSIILQVNLENMLNYLDKKLIKASFFISAKSKMSFADIRKRVLLFRDIELQNFVSFTNTVPIGKQKAILQIKERISELERQAELGRREGQFALDLLKLVLKTDSRNDIVRELSNKESFVVDNHLLEKVVETHSNSFLIKKAMEYQVNALISESEALRIRERLERTLNKKESDYRSINVTEIESEINTICSNFYSLVSLAEDVSSEYSQLVSGRAVVMSKDPVDKESRDVDLVMFVATISCMSMFIAVLISLLAKYIRRIRTNVVQRG